MAHWANRQFSEPESVSGQTRPAEGTRLDQILADLKARSRTVAPEPESERLRNVTPLNTPFRAEIQSLQASIDQLADKMDSQRVLDAITDLSTRIESLHDGRSLGEPEMRLLRSIRRSLDDLLYQMNMPQPAAEIPAPKPAPVEEAPPVFGRRAAPPETAQAMPRPLDAPRLEAPFVRQAPAPRKPWPGSALIRQYPLASVAAAATFAILLAQGVTQFTPRLGDVTGSIRPSGAVVPQRPKAAAPADTAAVLSAPVQAPARQDAAPPPAPAPQVPVMAYAPPPSTPLPAAAPVPPVPQQIAARPADETGGLSAYQAGVRLADGPARDYRGAIQMFEKAGDVPAAQFRLALLYERGQGAPKNPALARALYQRAAEKGHVRAMHNLGVLYADGVDGKPDYAAAAEWFRRAADYGLRDSEYNLATLTARGLGVEKKPAAAYTWFALAAAQGDADAARQRDEIGKTLDAATLKSAKAAAESFRPKQIDPVINQTAANP